MHKQSLDLAFCRALVEVNSRGHDTPSLGFRYGLPFERTPRQFQVRQSIGLAGLRSAFAGVRDLPCQSLRGKIISAVRDIYVVLQYKHLYPHPLLASKHLNIFFYGDKAPLDGKCPMASLVGREGSLLRLVVKGEGVGREDPCSPYVTTGRQNSPSYMVYDRRL
jgi:hypothetical protein